VSLNERRRLLREASRAKMRAMRLRSLGDESEQAEAIKLLRDAAQLEVEALNATPEPSDEEHAGARIEACGLYLEAHDPVRALEQWRLLPRWAFTSSAGAAMLSKLQPPFSIAMANFSEAWRSLKKTVDAVPALQDISFTKLRSLTEVYPGVAELWWALSKRADVTMEALQARERMLALNPSLQDEKFAELAWRHIEDLFVRRIRIEMQSEQRNGGVFLTAVGRISTAIGEWIKEFVETTFGEEAEFLPSSATPGSFILTLAAEGVPPTAIEELDRALASRAADAEDRRLSELLALLLDSGIKLVVSTVPLGGEKPSAAHGKLVIDAKRRRTLLDVADAAALKSIDSNDIPQADHLDRVFRIVELMAQRIAIDAETLDITPRQVNYYKRATKILGFLTEAGELTASGRLIARLDEAERLKATVVHFESSACGDAWIRWSGGRTLLDVEPCTAFNFLQDSVPNLNEETAARRAGTLQAWYRTLQPHHYALLREEE